MGGFDGAVGVFEWDASPYVVPTAEAMYAHGSTSTTPWEDTTDATKEEWVGFAVAVLSEVLPVIVADAVRAASKHLGKSTEVLEARSTTGGDR